MKDAVVAHNASPMFRVTPYVVFGAMCCAAAIVPSLATDLPFAQAADAIALVGLFALARVSSRLPRWTSAPPSARWARGARCSSASSPSRRC